MPGGARRLAPELLAAIAAFLVFLPSLWNGFVAWDDDMFLLGQTGWRGVGPEAWRWAFASDVGSVWQPLAWLSYGLDHALWGLRPAGYHLTSALIHAGAAAALCAAARELLKTAGLEPARAGRAGLFAALLFALHPLRVESVAWTAERRDVLSGCLVTCALLAYLRKEGKPSGALLILHALALLAKAQAAVLPLLLLVLDAWPLRRCRRRNIKEAVREKLPLFALSGAAVLIAGVVQERIRWPLSQHGILSRLAQAFYGLAFYVRKTLWPGGLAPLYELRPPLDPLSAPFLLSMIAVLALGTSIWRQRRSRPWLAASAAFYAAALSPVLGLGQFGPQLVADRYSYIAALPLAALGGVALARLWERPLGRAASAAALVALALACVRQQAHWRDSEALWTRVASVDPLSATARLGLGSHRAAQGRVEEAARLFNEALALDGGCVAPQDVLAASRRQGREPDFAEALAWEIERRPVCRKARLNRAVARAQLGQLRWAESELETISLALPNDEIAAANLARARAVR